MTYHDNRFVIIYNGEIYNHKEVEKTLQIYGRSFDDIKLFVDGIAYMTNVSYDGIKNIL